MCACGIFFLMKVNGHFSAIELGFGHLIARVLGLWADFRQGEGDSDLGG